MPLPSILDRRTSARLTDAILSLQPTMYWPLDDSAGPLRDISGRGWTGTVTGTPTFGVGAPGAIERGVTWDGSSSYASSSGSVPQSSTISSLIFLRTTNASASERAAFSRISTGGNSCWNLSLLSGHNPQFGILTSAGALVAAAAPAGAINDGNWWMIGGTANESATDLWCYKVSSTGAFSSAQDNTWSGTWNRTAFPIRVATSTGAAQLLAATVAHAAHWSRVLSAADFRAIAAAAFGG